MEDGSDVGPQSGVACRCGRTVLLARLTGGCTVRACANLLEFSGSSFNLTINNPDRTNVRCPRSPLYKRLKLAKGAVFFSTTYHLYSFQLRKSRSCQRRQSPTYSRCGAGLPGEAGAGARAGVAQPGAALPAPGRVRTTTPPSRAPTPMPRYPA
jgi:hypothetical protein